MSSKDFCVCLNCKFYDDMDAGCHRYPPVYAGKILGPDNEMISHWVSPTIDNEWADWCGEWQPANPEHSEDDRREQIKQALADWLARQPESTRQMLQRAADSDNALPEE